MTIRDQLLLALLGCFLGCLGLVACEPGEATTAESYSIDEIWLEQPLEHGKPGAGTLEQQIFVLVPETATAKAAVFFVLGNESDSRREDLSSIYRNYGSPEDMVFILAEHRGYGQSMSREDQTRPVYVRVAQALNDYHRVVEHFKAIYTGKWIAAGYSYGAALVVNFAHDFPEDVDVILASSAPIHWPFQIPMYSSQVMKNLGVGLAERLAEHNLALQPQALYDETWQERELLTGTVVGLSQIASQQGLKPYLDLLSHLPTSLFMAVLKWILPQESHDWVDGRIAAPMPYDRAKSGRLNWYTWKYQQCTEVGTFFIGPPFSYTRQEHIDDCVQTFGESPEYFDNQPWDIAGMISRVSIPQVVVVGGRDPWSRIGVEREHQYDNIEYLYVPDGYHCPDRDDPELAAEVMSLLLRELSS